MASLLTLSFVLLMALLDSVDGQAFNFSLLSLSFPFEVRVDSTLQPLLAPMAFTDSLNNVGIAPAGSWLLYGTQSDVWITTNFGSSWSLAAGQNGNGLPGLDNVTWATTGSGNSGCAHRTTFNRFYWMGLSNQNSAAVRATASFFNYVSVDGQEWINIIDAASVTRMTARLASEFGMCVVDKSERVYSILGADTWISNNLGVTWNPVQASTYFPTRQSHSGGIYYVPGTQQENIVIMAGRGWSTASPYGTEYNDCWLSTNYGASWQQQTSQAPWTARENPNVVISVQGVIALNGGNLCGGYGCGYTTGPYVYVGWLSDSWASFDNGVTWQLLASQTSSQFAQAATIIDSNGYWYTFAGQTGPANNTNYAWTNSGYKSTLSLTQIASWAPTVGLTVPSSWTGRMTVIPAICSLNTSTTTPPGGGSTGGAVTSSGLPSSAPVSASSGSQLSSSSSGLSGGAIAGIVIGSVVGALVLLCVLYFFCFSSLTRLRKDVKIGETTGTGSFDQVEESTASKSAQDVEMV